MFRASASPDLDHRLATARQVAREAGAVMASPFNRPDTSAGGMPLGEAQRRRVPGCARSNRALRNHGSGRRGDDSKRVLIAVRIDADDVIHLLCKHP